MTIITGSEYKANQGKYIERAQEGERVIISSYGGYVELKPVPETDKDVAEHIKARSFLAVSSRLHKEVLEGKSIRINSIEELHRWFDSL